MSLKVFWWLFSRSDLAAKQRSLQCPINIAGMLWGSAWGLVLPDLAGRCLLQREETLQDSTTCQKGKRTNCMLQRTAPEPDAIHPERHSEKLGFRFAQTKHATPSSLMKIKKSAEKQASPSSQEQCKFCPCVSPRTRVNCQHLGEDSGRAQHD